MNDEALNEMDDCIVGGGGVVGDGCKSVSFNDNVVRHDYDDGATITFKLLGKLLLKEVLCKATRRLGGGCYCCLGFGCHSVWFYCFLNMMDFEMLN